MNKEFVVLIVEDDSMTRNVIVETLRFDGFKTEEADGFRSSPQGGRQHRGQRG